MGGDRAPEQVVLGAAQAAQDFGVDLTVVGQPGQVQTLVDSHTGLTFVPASQVIGMDEHPAQAVRSKPDSSLAVCARLCKDGAVDAWVSAGNSGAIMAAALFLQGRIRGVDRPTLGTILPARDRPCYFVDVGANVDSRPDFLVQFAPMGAVFAEQVLDRRPPRVGLLANGEEDSKGDELVREVHRRLREEAVGFEFAGNVEPKEVVAGRGGVVVTDGVVGNVPIKMGEATADLIMGTLREEIPRTLRGKIGGLLIRPSVDRIRRQLDWREFGGAPLLAIDGVAVVAHGRSDARALRSAVGVAKQAVEAGLVQKIREAVGT